MLTFLFVLFLLINGGLLVVDLIFVLLSYSIFWYEHSNNNPSAYDQRFNFKSLKLALSLILPELFFNFLTVTVMPFALFNRRNNDPQRGVTPIILLHGLFDNGASWFWFKQQLKKQGIVNITAMNLSSWHNEEVLTELVSKRIDELRHQLGVNKVHLIGHSMGGIIARNYVQLRGGAEKVDQLICIGTPHHGSKLAPFSISPLGKLLIPGSGFLQRLNSAPQPDTVGMTNIFTRKDNMVIPNSSFHLNWGMDVELDGIGHTSLIYRRAVVKATLNSLKGKSNP
jgi:pimeloyl-ACP methyl ester carboxylesterase